MNEKYARFVERVKNITSNRLETEIHDWDVIKNLISCVMNDNVHGTGRNVLDFIDNGSWDYIGNLTFHDSLRRVEFEWSKGTLFHIYIESLMAFENDDIVYVLLKGYYNDEKNLNRIYSPKCSSHTIGKFGEYMINVERIVRREVEDIQIPNINCYTACMLTRPITGQITSNHLSRKLMEGYNLLLASNKFDEILEQVTALDEYDRDSLQEKGNTARRYFEYLLMLINMGINYETEIDYQKQMLGDLVGVIDQLDYTPKGKNDVINTQNTLNLCSHHGGVRITKEMLIDALKILIDIKNAFERTDVDKLRLKNILKNHK